MLEFALRAFLTLFVIVDPLGLVPVFVSLVGDKPAHEQRRVARRAVLIGGGVMLGFALGGRPLFAQLGVTLDALRVAGGILLFKIAVDMVLAQRTRETPEEEAEAQSREDVSIFPLAIPMVAGPGTLASLLVLTADASGASMQFVLVLVMAAVVLVIAYAVLHASAALSRVLGQTGVNVVTRVLGVILAALAVQYVADGALALWTRT